MEFRFYHQQKLCTDIDKINEQKLSSCIDNNMANDQIKKITNSFNRMLNRINQAFEREKRFSADAAHKLKTLLTVMKTSIDILEMSTSLTEDEYSETIKHLKIN